MFPPTSVFHPYGHPIHPSTTIRPPPPPRWCSLSSSSSSSFRPNSSSSSTSSLPPKSHSFRRLPPALPLLLSSILLLAFLLTLGIIFSVEQRRRGEEPARNAQKDEEAATANRTEAEAPTGGRRRFRRQIVPANNVLVYATNSNVSVADRVQVLSAESHIRLLERHLNATVWSNASLLQMSPSGDQLALSASRAIALAMTLSGGARVEGTGDTLQLNRTSGTSPSSISSSDFPAPPPLRSALADSSADGVHSRMEAELTGQRVNVSWTDPRGGAIAFRASDARVAALMATGWSRPDVLEQIRILSAPSADGLERRELSIVANSPEYQVQIRLVGAETGIRFRGARLDIPSDHRSLLLRALGWRLSVHSLVSPFELLADDAHLRVNCFDEALVLDVRVEAVELRVGQQSSLLINRSMAMPGKLRVNGGVEDGDDSAAPSLLTDRMEMVSRELRLSLSRGESPGQQSVLIDATNSHLRLAHASRTTATLTAAKHYVEMIGGRPVLGLGAGNVSVQMEVGPEEEEADQVPKLETDIVPRDLEAEAEFDIGPFPSVQPAPDSFRNASGDLFSTTALPSSLTSSSLPSSSSPLAPIVFPTSVPPSAQSSIVPIPTPLMAAPGDLFAFRHTFPRPTPSSASSIDSSAPPADQFPSPAPALFTFPPSGAPPPSPDSDFLVGQFETVPPGASSRLSTNANNLFPISATISSIQFPAAGEEEVEQFPGIRRENLLIWKPEDIFDQTKEKTTTAPETEYSTPEGTKQKRKVRGSESDFPEEMGRMEMEMNMVVEGEEDVRAERLRRNLREGLERMMREERRDEGEEEEGWKKKRMKNEEEGWKRRMKDEAKGREEEDERREMREAEGRAQLRVSEVQLEHVEDPGRREAEMVRVHFTVEGNGDELAKAVNRIRGMDKGSVGEALKHEILSINVLPSSLPSSSSSPSPSSSTFSAIFARSLPVLLAGSLALAMALLAMVITLRPLSRAIMKTHQWLNKCSGKQRTEAKENGRRAGTGGMGGDGN